MRVLLLVSLCASSLAGCASVEKPGCTVGEQATVSEMLYFGMAIPTGGTVSREDWATFLGSVVTPRFPEGLTSWSASGQWRGNDGQIVHEDSYVLTLLHPADAARERDVQAIVAEYKKRFSQEAVLRVRARVCTSL